MHQARARTALNNVVRIVGDNGPGFSSRRLGLSLQKPIPVADRSPFANKCPGRFSEATIILKSLAQRMGVLPGNESPYPQKPKVSPRYPLGTTQASKRPPTIRQFMQSSWSIQKR